MALYNSTNQKIKKDDYAKELYRFQGSNSYNCIKSNTIDNNGYLYFSNSLDHHKYFTLKKMATTISLIYFLDFLIRNYTFNHIRKFFERN